MKKQYDIVGNRKKFFIFSAVLIVFILLFSVIFGVEMDIQFKGGAMLTYSYTGELDISAVQKDIESTLGSNVTLQTGSSIASDAQTLTISMPGTQTVETATVEALSVRLEENYSDNSFRQLSLNNVDPTIGKEFFAKSIDKLRTGGIMAFITSSGTLDKKDDRARKYIAERCDLIGAVRLPATRRISLR